MVAYYKEAIHILVLDELDLKHLKEGIGVTVVREGFTIALKYKE